MKEICAAGLIVISICFVFSGNVNLAPLDLRLSLPVGRLGLTGLAFAQDIALVEEEINFSLYDLNGDKITLSKFRNKNPAVLFFWTTWCPFCLRELGYLAKIYASLSSDNIGVLAINVQESESKLSRFLKRNPLPFKVLLDSDGSVAYSYGLIGVPTYVLIDKRGEIVFQDNYFPQSDYKSYLIGQ
jgi:peroxiredoxin